MESDIKGFFKIKFFVLQICGMWVYVFKIIFSDKTENLKIIFWKGLKLWICFDDIIVAKIFYFFSKKTLFLFWVISEEISQNFNFTLLFMDQKLMK